MPLDMKHLNIGSTVAMKLAVQRIGFSKEDMVGFGELFELEAQDCDYHDRGTCSFPGSDPKCGIETCPLGELADDELTKAANRIHSKSKLPSFLQRLMK